MYVPFFQCPIKLTRTKKATGRLGSELEVTQKIVENGTQGIPIKHEIRPKDEEYWDEYRGSPKAFITHQAAQEMWGNRWGSYTGLRISGRKETELLADKLSKELRPSDFGIQVIDFKECNNCS